ncbi:MAG: glycerol-3-phosphate 1-O-acyltransferase PlsY [Selenomonadaceae bacterium]|nr:glycerol-3-phosphate 1-O-acyltransferase PlsY [Selenomonadaceae bacterium]
MDWVLLVLTAYLIGSLPIGLILTQLIWKKDIRRFGSHNIGATNAWRVIGKGAGLLVFLIDFIKGQLGVLIGAYYFASPGAMALGGLFAIIGAIFPITLGFKGGKGVSTSLGVLVALMPKITIIVLVVWLVVFLFSRYVSLASIVAAALTPILAALFKEPIIFFLFSLVIALVVILRHKDNIERLKAGRENRM